MGEIVKALKRLAVKFYGSGSVGDITATDIAGAIDACTAKFANYTLPAATESALGGVKMAANAAVAASDAPTKAEFDALIAVLIAAGLMAAPAEDPGT